MRKLAMTFWAAVCTGLLPCIGSVRAADPKLWKTYCDDAVKSANERRFTEANQFMSMALAVAEQFGAADQRLVETLFLAAGVHEGEEEYAEAEPHRRRALALREAKLGTNDINVAECAYHLGRNLGEQRKFAGAEAMLKRAEHIAKWKTNSYHPIVGLCQAALARACLLAGRHDQADKLYTGALRILGTLSFTKQFSGPNEIQESVFVPNYRRVMQIRFEQAQNLHLAKKFKDSEDAYKKLIKLVEEREGKDHELLAIPLLDFGALYADLKKYAAAEGMLLRRQQILTKHLGQKHPEHLRTMKILERVYREQNKLAEADLLARQLAEAGLKPAPAK